MLSVTQVAPEAIDGAGPEASLSNLLQKHASQFVSAFRPVTCKVRAAPDPDVPAPPPTKPARVPGSQAALCGAVPV